MEQFWGGRLQAEGETICEAFLCPWVAVTKWQGRFLCGEHAPQELFIPLDNGRYDTIPAIVGRKLGFGS